MASKFAEYKVSCMGWNKAENKRRTQGSAWGYLEQPATGTDWQGCKRFPK